MFDTVYHGILFQKLEQTVIIRTWHYFYWLHTYKKRKQFVELNGIQRNEQIVVLPEQ